jgi:glycosyltransferase involved in cell wall biosynthesis
MDDWRFTWSWELGGHICGGKKRLMAAMRPVKLAVFFDQKIHAGGGYQQALNAAILVKELSNSIAEPIYFTLHKESLPALSKFGIDAIYLPVTFATRAVLWIRRRVTSSRTQVFIQKVFGDNSFERVFRRYGVDLVYFLAPTGMADHLETLNYIFSVWDLCHRDDPEFPEVRTGRTFEVRERLYRGLLPKATAVLVESSLGKDNVTYRYGLEPDRVYVMPLTAAIGTEISDSEYLASFVDIKKKYHLDVRYVFYPANFWAHKNHVYLLEGLKLLSENHGHKIGAIFSGGDSGNLAHVRRITEVLNLGDRVRFIGFVSNEEIPYLYKQSLALVMPTYFGPTNLPPLEAFQLNVPVLYSDKIGLRDQVGDAALLMNLGDPSSMANHLAALISTPELASKLANKGRTVLLQNSYAGRLDTLATIIKDFQRRRACWG